MVAVLLSESEGLGAAFGTLVCFLLATIAFAFSKRSVSYDSDTYMVARNTQGVLSLTLSFFASGAGAWIIFAVPEAAILGGPITLFGYVIACIVPLVLIGWITPILREKVPTGITFFEYVQVRYGTYVNVYVTLTSLFYMFLYLSAEFTAVGQAIDLLCGTVPTGDLQGPGLAVVIGTSLITMLYTSYGGLPISLTTDKVQGVGMIALATLVTIAACAKAFFPAPAADTGPENTALSQLGNATANWEMVTSYGINNEEKAWKFAITLIIAITCANLLHTGFHQRIWAARDTAAVRQGACMASALTFFFMLFFGFMGMVSFARYGFSLVTPVYLAFLSAFWLIQELAAGWQVLAIILVVSMVASSCDTLQTGITALMHPITERILAKLGMASTARTGLVINFAVTAIINVPAIIMSTQNVSVLTLFVLADLICATCIVPVLLGLWVRIHHLAALSGCLVGAFTALVIFGVGINGEAGNYKTLTMDGGLYSETSFWAFVLTPLCSAAATLLTNIPFFLKGYKFDGYAVDAPHSKEVEVKVITGGPEVIKVDSIEASAEA